MKFASVFKTWGCGLAALSLMLLMIPRVRAAGSTTTSGQVTGGSQPGSGNSGSSTSSGSLSAESKSAIYGALAKGMNEIAAELRERNCLVVFNLPISAQEVAGIAVLEGALDLLNQAVNEAEEIASKQDKLDKLNADLDQQLRVAAAVKRELIKDLGLGGIFGVQLNEQAATAAPGGGSSPTDYLGDVASLAGNLNIVAGAVSAVIDELAKFKNQSTNSAGSVGLDTQTVNGLMTVALHNHQVRVYDFLKMVPQSGDMKNGKLFTGFKTFSEKVWNFNTLVVNYSGRFDRTQKLYKEWSALRPPPPADVAADMSKRFAEATQTAQLLQHLQVQFQTQLNLLLGKSDGSQNAKPATPADKATLAVPDLSPMVLNTGPLAQYLLAELQLQQLRRFSCPETYFVTCRLVSADATETTVTRYILENYMVSSAITTLEVDAFDLNGECKYAASIENRGANLYWFSRIKDAAQISPSLVRTFRWIFHPPRQPQFALTREESSLRNIQREREREFAVYPKSTVEDDAELFDRIRLVLQTPRPRRLRVQAIAAKLHCDQDAIIRCVTRHSKFFQAVRSNGCTSYFYRSAKEK